MTPVFEVRNLKKSFGGLAVTDNVSLSLRPGDRVALIGPNGAGKTTFVNLVTGNLKPDAGEVLMAGETLTRSGPAERVRRGLVRSFQVTRLFQDMSPAEHIALAILQRDGRANNMTGSYLDRPEVMAETNTLLAALGLETQAHRKVREIADGQQRLLEIAMALALEPSVLVADEPTTALDVTTQAQILRLIRDLQRKRGMSVLFITHDLGVVAEIADYVAVLQRGRLVESGTA